MRIDPAAADLVATRLREICVAEPCEQRADDHYGTSERRTLADKISAFDIRRVYIVGPERIHAFLMPGNLHSHTLKKKDKIADVKDFRHIGNRDFLRSQQYGTYHFQCLVLGSLRPDHTAQLMSAFDYKCAHVQIFIYVRLPESVLCRMCLLRIPLSFSQERVFPRERRSRWR